MRNGILVLMISLLGFQAALSQDIAIGQWREHLPYTQGRAVAQLGDKVYCATEHALFSYDLEEKLIRRHSKVNGLSDIGVSTIAAHEDLGVLVIAYSNTNIDLLFSDNSLLNIPDIKRKTILGKKSINRIHFRENLAYLACGFGIVVLDLEREEIKDTYYIGPGGSQIDVMDVVHDDSMLYAATENGLYKVRLDEPNPADFSMWSPDNSLPNSNDACSALELYKDKLYCVRPYNAPLADSIYVRDNGVWTSFANLSKDQVFGLKTYRDQLMVISQGDVDLYDEYGQLAERIFSYSDGVPSPRDAIIGSDNQFWIADQNQGLVRSYNTWSSVTIHPQGPVSTNNYAIAVSNGNVWLVPGGHNFSWNNFYRIDGISHFDGSDWEHFTGEQISELDTVFDLISLSIDPSDPNHVFIGSWGNGLLEIRNGQLEELYSVNNSSLQSSPQLYFVGIAGMTYDASGNLWVTNSLQTNALSMRSPDGLWRSYNLSPVITTQILGDIIIDDFGQKWILLPRSNGMIVFDDNNTPDIMGDDQKKKLTTGLGNGNLPSNNILCLAKDRDGEIWLGTDKGIAVIYAPGNAFSGGNFDAQQILVEYDGYVQNLLESETVTSIAIDGANRKWVGTERAGVFLISEDGTSEIHHFTTENSALLSDQIIDIAIDQQSGEVFFATESGLVSYRGTATSGGQTHQNVYAYPNPVRPEYYGIIAIKGLVDMADVKITDIDGNVVHATIAQGGQATWDGTDMNGERVHTGVYLVFSTNTDETGFSPGEETMVTKILFIR